MDHDEFMSRWGGAKTDRDATIAAATDPTTGLFVDAAAAQRVADVKVWWGEAKAELLAAHPPTGCERCTPPPPVDVTTLAELEGE